MSRIAVLGTGKLGRNAGRRWARKGHDVFFGSRDTARGRAAAERAGSGARGGSVRDAVRDADMVLLAVPYDALATTLAAAGALDGKILIDPINPWAPAPTNASKTDSTDTKRCGSGSKTIDNASREAGSAGNGTSNGCYEPSSVAERIAGLAPHSTVVKALNTIGVELLAPEGARPPGKQAATAFVCGDRTDANRRVMGLMRDLELEPVDVGALDRARYLEPTALLLRDLDKAMPRRNLRLVLEFE